MLGRREEAICFGDLWIENQIDKDSFWYKLRKFTDNYLTDDLFEDLFSSFGRKSIPPVYTFIACLIQLKTNQSDREMEGSTRFDARYKYAMGAPQDYPGIDAVTLCDHRNLFFENNTTMKIFKKTLSIAAEEGFFEDEHLNVIDSFMVEGYSAKQSTYQMIYLAIKKTLKIIKMQGIKLPYFELIRSDYEENIKKPKIDWSLKEEKESLLDDLVKDAKVILKALENSNKFNNNPEIKRSYELLKKVSTQDVKKNQNGKYEMIRGTAKDRTISINDPEMRHGHKTTSKKSDGYKCEIITGGEKGKYILATRVFPANVPDGTYMGELIDQIKEYDLDLDVKVLLGDTAYCDFEEIERLEKEEEMEFIIKAQPHKKNNGLFTKEDFDINLEEMKVTCPAGNVKEIKKEGKSIVKFPKKVCDDCPKKKECTESKSGRTISINKHEERLQEQREKQKTDEFKKEYNSRSNGERTIYTMTSRGGRLARFVGEFKVHQQEILVAIFTNIQNLMGDLFKREKSCTGDSVS